MLCVLLMATGCNANTDKTDEITSETASQTTSASMTEVTSITDTTTVQNEQTVASTTESITETAPMEAESDILKLERKRLYDYAWSEEYGVSLAELDCSTIHLANEDAEIYPELAKALSDECDLYEVNMLEEHDMFISDAEKMLSSGEQGFDTLVSTLDVHIRRADDVVLSILYDSYYYNGMNDGSRSFWGNNYDTQTGKAIYLPDVVTDMEELAEVAEAQLFSDFGAEVFYSDTVI